MLLFFPFFNRVRDEGINTKPTHMKARVIGSICVCVLHMLWSHFYWAYFICSEYIQTITRIVWKYISTAADSCGPEFADGKQHSTLFYLWSEGDFLMWEFQKSQCNWAGGVDYTAFCFLVQSLHSTEMFCLVRMSTPLEPHCVQKNDLKSLSCWFFAVVNHICANSFIFEGGKKHKLAWELDAFANYSKLHYHKLLIPTS